jgi:hypothetical protein
MKRSKAREERSMRKVTAALVMSGWLVIQVSGASADAARVAQAPPAGDKAGSAEQKMPGKGAKVRDKQKLDAVKVGDPVVAV